MSKSGKAIRAEFIQYFQDLQHSHVVSSSLLPADDPTLLFANAGMNQFKPVFLGTEARDYTRAVNSQKCIRAGGKHNDLDDVGRDCYHHTFFEMLGNWSFGDYFKVDAIDWAWDLLVNRWGLAPERLHATYFEGSEADGLDADLEARDLWLKYLPADRIHTGNKKDNFWEMGETGPCGPCSEIHYDGTDDFSGGPMVNKDDPRVIEIWNLVFMQFNRDAAGVLAPLPAQHVDTGMGLERVTAVIQGKQSNYATDLFTPIIEAIEAMSGKQYGEGLDGDRYDSTDDASLVDVAMRVISDHVRTLTFAIADGILPSNDGRGYVLRSILRRAAGFGRQHLGIEGNFLHTLVEVVVEAFGDAFGELVDRKQVVVDTVREEEESFGKTLDRGLTLFDRLIETARRNGEKKIEGMDAFELHATYGFPITLTKLMAEKAGLSVDELGFAEAMETHRNASRGDGGKFKADAVIGLPASDDGEKFSATSVDAKVLGWVIGDKFITEGTLDAGTEAAVVLDRTCFYGESGGQVGDTGELLCENMRFVVSGTTLAGSCVLHAGALESGSLRVGSCVSAALDMTRRTAIVRNHSATHLLNWALRQVLGDGVNQAGSVVDAERLRFDFTNSKAVTSEQLAEVELLVNGKILADLPIIIGFKPLDEAKQIPGVRAVFGEKYPDPVRVAAMGPDVLDATQATDAVEFCGGVHLARTSQIGLMKIVNEESVAKGVRRISAVTGDAAAAWVTEADGVLRELAAVLKVKPDAMAERVLAMQKEIKKLKKRPAAAAGGGGLSNEVEVETPAGKIVVAQSLAPDAGAMRNAADQLRQKGAVAVFLGAADADEGKVILIAMCDDEIVKGGKLRAGDWVKNVAPVVGGGGGGKPNLAQAGGKIPAKLPDALAVAAEFAKEQLG
ncbi:MAG: alanine--tRNA ligase [Phycisphaerales bacterium]|jgi:alanyl-tRNA synthetase|nr:alanine--tRNA ligase [Phycisphaerales bacterium]MBT7171406.1 alanine--tRNA ligase [Phycisphaerales bacterium]